MARSFATAKGATVSAVVQSAVPWTLPAPFAPMQPYPQWFIYRLHSRDASGKYRKEPIDARTRAMPNKGCGGINMCADWSAVSQTCAELAATARAGELYVPGFWFTASDPFWFLDIDGCVIEDKQGKPAWSQLALDLLATFPNAARELSSSAKGWHLIGCGAIPAHSCKNTALHLEFYTAERGVAITGTHASGSAAADCTATVAALVTTHFPPGAISKATPTEWRSTPVALWRGPDDDEELIRRALSSNSAKAIFGDGASFADLWTANEDKLLKAFPSANDVFDRSGADQALANRLAFWTGSNHERILQLMRRCEALARDKWERPDYLPRTITKACATQTQWYVQGEKKEPTAVPTPSEDDPRQVILLLGGQLNQYAAKAESLMVDSLYVYGDSLVRIGRAAEISNEALTDNAGTTRGAMQAVCIPASSAWLRRALMTRARFLKYDKRAREWEPRDCPKELADNIVDQEAWASFRTLTAITSVPILRPDMSVRTLPGYDSVTCLYYQPTVAIPPIPPTPTRDDALSALARLREPFSEFPYASDASEAVFISHVLTSALRASFDTSPIYCYTSPIAATGKTLLAEMAQRVATGVEPAQSPFSEGEELRKVLFASLLAGDSSIIFDNLQNGVKVRAPELCRFATSSTYSDRVLGASKKREIPNRCTVVLTGNNITPVSDLARRSLCCRLDVNGETARGRTFRIADLKGYVRERRIQLIVDAITVTRAYAFAGRPKIAHPLESFVTWSQLVRDPLVWLGMVDPVTSQETETEDGIEPLREAFGAIVRATSGLTPRFTFTTAQLAALVIPPAPLPGADMQDAIKLREALAAAGCPKSDERLGYWLREHKGKVAGAYKLVNWVDKHTGSAIWQMAAME